MKKLLILNLLFAIVTLTVCAQPKFAAKVQKSILTLHTYDSQGNLLHRGTAFYIGPNGEAIADYKLFKGAYKATVTEASQKKAEVECILGADDTYSVVRFRVATKGNAFLSPATSFSPMKSDFFAVGNTENGTIASGQGVVADTAMIQGKYVYYTLDRQLDGVLSGTPVFNSAGTLVGMVHATLGGKSHVLDIRFAEMLRIAAIPSQSASLALSNIFIPKDLPDTQEEALVYIYFKSRTASNEEYMGLINRFVDTYPQNAEGYLRRATPLIDLLQFDEAESDLQKHLTLVKDKAVGHYNVAATIHDKLRLQPEPAYDKWTYDIVLQHVDEALRLNATTADSTERKANEVKFLILKGQVLMSKGDHEAALAIYEQLSQRDRRNASYLYAISMAREGRGDSLSMVIEPLDSALSMMGEPLPREAANYLIRRGQLYANNGKYREAVQDYNQYCYLLNNRVSAVFYYERSQIEVNARMFQQALEDIDRAVGMEPRNPVYQVEKAALAIRFDRLDECIKACEAAIQLNPSIIDSYRILGYAQLQKGDKVNARINLEHAVEMGDDAAKKILETYFK